VRQLGLSGSYPGGASFSWQGFYPQNLHQGRLLGGSRALRASLRRAFSSLRARTSPSKASILATTSRRRASSRASSRGRSSLWASSRAAFSRARA
jgi:hypothetical protein